MAKTPDQMAAKWKAAMGAGTTRQNYVDGINSTTENPMAKAASPEAMTKYLNRVQESVSSGKRANALNAASFSGWKTNSTTVGANSLSSGAVKAAAKVQAHFQKWGPIYQQSSAAAKAIPHDGSMASAMARVQAAMSVMMQAAGH